MEIIVYTAGTIATIAIFMILCRIKEGEWPKPTEYWLIFALWPLMLVMTLWMVVCGDDYSKHKSR